MNNIIDTLYYLSFIGSCIYFSQCVTGFTSLIATLFFIAAPPLLALCSVK